MTGGHMGQNTIQLKTRRGEFRAAVDGDAAAPVNTKSREGRGFA